MYTHQDTFQLNPDVVIKVFEEYTKKKSQQTGRVTRRNKKLEI